jgi:5-dehydro-2-deoxygluconokinase
VIGFAVGRTVFWEPLKTYQENKCSKEEAIAKIAANYQSLCKLWLDTRANS